jgi:glycerol-3-phosphate O-acyltransferase
MRKIVLGLCARVQMFPHSVECIRTAARTSHVIYALKHQSEIDLNFLKIRFAELGLPVPVMRLTGATCGVSGTGAIRAIYARVRGGEGEKAPCAAHSADILKTVLLNGSSAVFPLIDDDVFRRRYINPDEDPLKIILDCQGRLAGAISIIPLTILYDRAPRPTVKPFRETLLGDPDRPGLVRRFVRLFRTWTVPEVLVGEPVNLVGEFEEFGAAPSWEELPFALRTRLIANINARIRVNRGPEQPSRAEIKERVLQDAKVNRLIVDIATNEHIPQEKLRKKAESYVEEIAEARSMRVIWMYYRVLQWVFRHVFDGIDSKESQFVALKDAGRKGPLIFVSCHKSHFDYLVVSFLAFSNNMAIPSIAAGSNLSFWPLGPILRHGAAFFMRRSFKGQDLYREVFVSYVKTLLATDHSIKYYAEGGRSRIGRLLPPRLGFLSFLLEAVADGAVEDLTFVPSFIGYEQVPEESSYLSELAGQDKKQESVASLLNVRSALSKRYGKLYVRFHPTISLSEFRNKRAPLGNARVGEFHKDGAFLEDLGYHLMAGIVRAGVVSSVETSAHAILCAGEETFTLEAVATNARLLWDGLAVRGTETAGPYADGAEAVHSALTTFESRGFIERSGERARGDTLFKIVGEERVRLEFYANGLINYLWPIGLAAALTHPPHFPESPPYADFSALKTLLRRELIPDPLESDEALLDQALHFLRGLSSPRERGDDASSHFPSTDCFARLVTDLMTAYLHVIEQLEETKEEIAVKELQKRVAQRAEVSQTRRMVNSHSLSAVVVGGAVARLQEMKLLTEGKNRKFVNPPTEFEIQALAPWKRLLKRVVGV